MICPPAFASQMNWENEWISPDPAAWFVSSRFASQMNWENEWISPDPAAPYVSSKFASQMNLKFEWISLDFGIWTSDFQKNRRASRADLVKKRKVL